MDFGNVMRTFSLEKPLHFFDNGGYSEEFVSLARMYQLYNAGIKELHTKLEIFDSEFRLRYEHNPIHHIEYRLKSQKSIEQKLKKKNLPFTIENVLEHVTDVAGIRVICSYLEDIYHVSGLLLAQKDIKLIQKKDYIIAPKKSGYRSLHLVVSIPIYLSDSSRQIPVEIQLRTIAMDFWASLEHQIKYKSQKSIPQNLRQELLECANSITLLDGKMQNIHQKINQGSFAQAAQAGSSANDAPERSYQTGKQEPAFSAAE